MRWRQKASPRRRKGEQVPRFLTYRLINCAILFSQLQFTSSYAFKFCRRSSIFQVQEMSRWRDRRNQERQKKDGKVLKCSNSRSVLSTFKLPYQKTHKHEIVNLTVRNDSIMHLVENVRCKKALASRVCAHGHKEEKAKEKKH